MVGLFLSLAAFAAIALHARAAITVAMDAATVIAAIAFIKAKAAILNTLTASGLTAFFSLFASFRSGFLRHEITP